MLRSQIYEPLSIISCIGGAYANKDIDALKSLEALQSLNGKRVALHCHPAILVNYVINLDGIASSVLLVPFDACEAFSRRVENQVDLVIKDSSVKAHIWKTETVDISEISDIAPLAHSGINAKHGTKWLLATSGTTGTPKIVAHTIESLTRTMSKSFKGRHLDWGLLYDPARFAGFQVVLQAILANARLIIPAPDMDFESKVEYLADNQCNAISATPSLWRKILMTKTSGRLNLKQITLGGEIADQRIINSLAKNYPDAEITHIFASTEAGVGFSVKDKKAGFPLSWLSSGIRGVKLKISSQSTLCLKNTHLHQSYIGEGGPIADEEGWIDTGDLVEIDDDRVVFKGRLNGAINIGGNKVAPEEIESVILELPEVFQVAVRPKSNSITGSLIEALVVPSAKPENSSGLIKSIKRHCKNSLPVFKVPALIRLVDELPIGSAGKVKR